MCEPYKTSDEKTLIFKLNKAELIAIEHGLILAGMDWKNTGIEKEMGDDAHFTLEDLIRQEEIQRRVHSTKEVEEKVSLGRG